MTDDTVGMATDAAPRWEDTVPRRRVRIAAIIAVVVTASLVALVYGGLAQHRSEQAAQRLNAACQDNQQRAWAAAERVRGAKALDAAALDAAREYVKEIRTTPVCFAEGVLADAADVEQAVRSGQRPRPQYPKYFQ